VNSRYSAQVDAWLRSFGSEQLRDWLYWCRKFEKRLPILSICGPPGIGKTLLAKGLVECFGRMEPGRELVVVDSEMGRETIPQIREFTSANTLIIDRKYCEPVTVLNAVRVVVFGDDTSIIDQIGRDVSIHLDVTAEPRKYLTDIRGWVGGDMILARHILWIGENYVGEA
jgi:hypothetical protein